MGRALYRKYRSKSLNEIVGQEHITDTLRNALKKGSISHAYLFTGPRGTGKTSIARILAHAINDIDYTDESIHLDIIEIDAASNRRIDEIRELRDKVHITPTSSKYKVYIIDEVHMLTREAFNALLKTLEEPPEHAIFILATTEAHKVPDTIVSRTQRFTFKPIEKQKAITHLKSIAEAEKIAISDKALELITEHGNGSFRDSISMLDQLSGLDKESFEEEDVNLLLGLPNSATIEQIIQATLQNDTTELFSLVQSLKEQGVDSGRAARSISSQLRDSLISGSATQQTKVIMLLKNLLPLTSTTNDFIALEICLLQACTPAPDANTVQVPEAAQPPQPQKPRKQTLPKEAQIPDEKPAKHVQQPEKTDSNPDSSASIKKEFSKESWHELLDDIKGHHNTLYGTLRMAEATHDGKAIVLTFNFPFHKKRIDSPKNNSTLRQYVDKHFGGIQLITDTKPKSKAKVEPPRPKTQTANGDTSIENVSNIFGGAELLES